MRKPIIIVLICLVIIALPVLLSLLRASANEIPFLAALDQTIFGALDRLWDLLTQPIVLIALVIFIFLRLGIPNLENILPLINEVSASIGPLSMRGKFDPSRLLSDKEFTAESGAQLVAQKPEEEVVKAIIDNLDIKVANILIDAANTSLTNDEIINIVSMNIWGEGPKTKLREALSLGMSAGVIRSYRGLLFKYSRGEINGETKTKLAIDRSILDLIYERVKRDGLDAAPA